MQKATRIQDVALEAGVSTATVSRALSNPELLSDATRDAVFEAIRKTGYRVNRAARNLRTQRAGAVLVFVPNLGNPFFSEILAGISEGFSGSDYSVLIADSKDEIDRGRAIVDCFRDGRIDGVISLDGAFTVADLDQIEQAGVRDRIVFACEWVSQQDFPSVRSDNEKGAQLALRHLVELGHRKIAHVTGPRGNVLTRARREGMLAERERLGLPIREEWVIRGDFSLDSGQAAAARILAIPDRPSAVFCASDMVAFGLIIGLSAGGLRVPDDLAVVGFDDIEMSGFYNPALTTIRQDRRSLGHHSARLLLGQMDPATRSKPRDFVEVIDVELIARNSTLVR